MRVLIVCSLLAAGTAAQNGFGIYSGCTNYTSRGGLGTGAGENLLEVSGWHFSGVGHAPSGTGTILLGYRHMLQDQNAATVEPYAFVVRSDDGSGAPACGAGGQLLRTAPVSSPPGTRIMAWDLTATFSTPSTVLPQCASFYFGLDFAAAPAWSDDGLSTHIGTYSTYPTNGTEADNPARRSPNLGWNCINGVPAQPAGGRCIRYEVIVSAPVLNLGNTDPWLIGVTSNCVSYLLNSQGNPRSFGAGGLWPDIGSRRDGLDCRVRDAASPNGAFVVMAAPNARTCPGTIWPAIASGALYLLPSNMVQVAVGSLDASGGGEAVLVPPATIPPRLRGSRLDLQAMTLSATLRLPGTFTNRAAAQF
ncbi:MAG: hypothetical protein R3F56_24690 [Planctomycetota bacterium]